MMTFMVKNTVGGKGHDSGSGRSLTSTALASLACALLVLFAAPSLHAQFTFADVYDFNCDAVGSGCVPDDYGQLTQGTDGNLYGTSKFGGPGDIGTVFKVTPGGTYTDLVSFNGTNGREPEGALVLASDDNFYGTTSGGGTHKGFPCFAGGCGTVFKLAQNTKGKWILTTLHSFDGGDGYSPNAAPVEAWDGTIFALYGVTLFGNTYRVKLPSGTFESLPHLAPGMTKSPLYRASDGNLYGASMNGGNNACSTGWGGGCGTIFQMTPSGTIKPIYTFNGGSDGAAPAGPLTQGADNNLYGTTNDDGVSGSGTIFKVSLSGTFTALHSFDALVGGINNDGANPLSGLLPGPGGIFYGTTFNGGAYGFGTIFSITEAGHFTKIYDFTGGAGTGTPGTGSEAIATLMKHTNGKMYGLASEGGNDAGSGDFYSLTPLNPLANIGLCCNYIVILDQPVTIMGNGLAEATAVKFNGLPAEFQNGSDTFLIASVPANAVDGFVTVTLTNPAGGEQTLESQQAVHILPKITNLDPSSGPVGAQVAIVGGGFAKTKTVTFGGVKATSFRIVTPGLIQAIVPVGAKTGKIGVLTPNGSATSTETFTVN